MYKNQQRNFQFTRVKLWRFLGSILRFTLFLLYVNDLPCASNYCTTFFVDDTNLLFEHHCIKTFQSEVEMIKIEN